MEDILQQVGAFMLGAIPTMLLFTVLVLAYQFLVQGPLSRTLAERRARTEGAIEDAHKAIALAEARTTEYSDKLRQARAEFSSCASNAQSSATPNAKLRSMLRARLPGQR